MYTLTHQISMSIIILFSMRMDNGINKWSCQCSISNYDFNEDDELQFICYVCTTLSEV